MQVQVIDSATRNMASILPSVIEQSEEVKVAVAFVSRQGLAVIEPAIQTALKIGAYLEFVVCLDMQTTEPEAVQYLYELTNKNSNTALFCYAPLARRVIFHPKLYLLRAKDEVTSIVGSSNLTRGGLQRNFEVNVVMRGNMGDEAISNSYDAYNALKFHSKAKLPNEDALLKYLDVFQKEKEANRKAARDGELRKSRAAFNETFEALPRPKPTRRDLAGGWLELVYDALPSGEFSNEQVYGFEKLFQQRYPENRNIRAKIRQQLQMLRDMEFIKQLGTGRWRKL